LEKNKRNSLWLATQYSVSLLLSLIGLKLNLLTFGGPAFSIWLLIFSIWGVGAAVDFGFGISTVKFVAQYRDNSAKTNRIISTGFLLFLILGILIVLLGYGCAEEFYLHNTKLIPEEALPSSRVICYLSGLSFYISYLTIVFRSILEGHEDFVLTSKLSLSYSVMTFAFIVMVFLFHGTIIHLAFLYVIVAVLQFLAYYIAFRKKYPHLEMRFAFANIGTFREIIKFSVSVQITYFLGSLIDPAAKYIIGNFSQNRLIPPYEIAKRFSLAVSGLFTFSFKNVLPNVSKLKTNGEYIDYFFSHGVRISKLGILYSGLFFGILSIVFCGLLKFFYGYTEGIIMFLLFALAESINGTGFIVYVFILGIGRSDFLALLQLANVIMISLFLSIGYIWFGNSIGLLGYYFSVLFANIAMMLFVKKRIGISIIDFYQKIGIMKLVILNCLLLIAMFITLRNTNLWLVSQLILSCLCICLFYNEIKTYSKNVYDFGALFMRRSK
jgi:O-antigen/teichoic acid export membrane protein